MNAAFAPITKTFALPTMGIQESFSNKATVYQYHDHIQLKSYETIVAVVELKTADGNPTFHRTWSGWSATTARHINAFRALYGFDAINKAAWQAMPTERGRF